MQDDIIELDRIGQLQTAFDFIKRCLSMPSFRFEDVYPDPLRRADILYKRQMQRWSRQGVFLKPTSDRAQQAAIVKIEVRAIAEELEAIVAGLPDLLQKIHAYRLSSINLG